MIKQGQYLKEVGISFVLENNITPEIVFKFLDKLVKRIKMTKTIFNLNELTPGFDIYCGLKESFIYFGYWGEHKFVRLLISSCKIFDEKKIIKFIKKYFKPKTKLGVTLITDLSIKEEIEDLCQQKF